MAWHMSTRCIQTSRVNPTSNRYDTGCLPTIGRFSTLRLAMSLGSFVRAFTAFG